MNQKDKQKHRSISEFKKRFFPDLYRRELEAEKSLNPEVYATEISDHFLETVRKKLRDRLIKSNRQRQKDVDFVCRNNCTAIGNLDHSLKQLNFGQF